MIILKILKKQGVQKLMVKNISNIEEIIQNYDTFLIDQWGVIHNGGELFDYSINTFKLIKKYNKKIVLISNSGKTNNDTYQSLASKGITRDMYDDIVTSGDHMRKKFHNNKFNLKSNNALFLPWPGENEILNELGLNSVGVEYADFILCCGVDRQLPKYDEILNIAMQKNIPLIVTNPDLIALSPNGVSYHCPGSIALKYEQMGGKVYWHGKPSVEMYKMCFDIIGGFENAIGIGDSIEHDIKGANNYGIDSLLITSGIHKDEIKNIGIDKELEKFGIIPTYTIEKFI